MKLLSKLFLNCSIFALLPVVANAAGTYYTGGYQSPQTRYGQNSYSQRNANNAYSSQGMSAYTRNQYANAGYSNVGRTNQYQQNQYTGMPGFAGGNICTANVFSAFASSEISNLPRMKAPAI